MIEIGPNPDNPLVMLFHSSESGRFMPATRAEFEGLIDAVKRGVFDPMIRDITLSAAAWSAQQVAEQEEWDRTHEEKA
jgi:hypothetical protein